MMNADNSMAVAILGENLANAEKKTQMLKVAKFSSITGPFRFCATAKFIHTSF